MADDLVSMPSRGADTGALRKFALLCYLLSVAGLVFSMGLLSVVGLILAYVKRDDATGTLYRSHFDWMISTFWWTLFWVVVAFLPSLLLTVISFGLLSFLFLIPCLWFLYRMVKGLLRLTDERPVP